MSHGALDWLHLGFARAPHFQVSDGSLLLYRCWGARSPAMGSSEAGTGFFSIDKPTSVLDAELRFNIADWGNGIHFVSTFRLASGFGCWVGPVAHGADDLSRAGTQVHVESPLAIKLTLVRSKEVLRHDVFVAPVDGRA